MTKRAAQAERIQTSEPAGPSHELAGPVRVWPSRKQVRYSIGILVVTLALAQLDMAIVPYLAPSIKADLQLTDWEMGLLLGVSFGLFYTLIGIPSAWFVDRLSRKRIIAIGIATWSLGTALCGLAQNFLQLFVARFLVGGGEALNGPASYSLIGDLVPREKLARAIATYQSGAVLGQGVALLFGAYMLHLLLDAPPLQMPFGEIRGWQLVLVTLGLPGLLLCAVLAATFEEPARQLSADRLQRLELAAGKSVFTVVVADFAEALGYVRRRSRVFAPMFISIGLGGLLLGNAQWFPIFYQRTFGWAPAQVAFVAGLGALIFMPAGLFVSVKLNEWMTRRRVADAAMRVVLISSVIIVPAALLFPLMPSPWLSVAVACANSFALGMNQTASNAAIHSVTPGEIRGKMTALFLFTFFVTAVMLGPIVTAGLTTFLFRDESMIRWAIFTSGLLFGPLMLVIRLLGLAPYRREVLRLKALESPPASA